ncbi:MAG: preprotein translocase subunit SecE [Deltaproteobacteria bacterium]|nr:preprotein translocase subunit SecE [Deltaproteobacteria bacterium]
MAASEKALKNERPTGLIQFLKDSWAELHKVHHPTKQETIQATIVVFVMIFVFAIILGGIDLAWGWIMKQILT